MLFREAKSALLKTPEYNIAQKLDYLPTYLPTQIDTIWKSYKSVFQHCHISRRETQIYIRKSRRILDNCKLVYKMVLRDLKARVGTELSSDTKAEIFGLGKQQENRQTSGMFRSQKDVHFEYIFEETSEEVDMQRSKWSLKQIRLCSVE